MIVSTAPLAAMHFALASSALILGLSPGGRAAGPLFRSDDGTATLVAAGGLRQVPSSAGSPWRTANALSSSGASVQSGAL